jgi:hypothetical protein
MEQYKIIALIISLATFFVYVGFVWAKYGVQKSISDSYYCLPKNWRIVFTFFCWGFAVPILFISLKPLLFAGVFGIVMVGATPNFYLKRDGFLHYGGAISGILFSQLSLIYEQGIPFISLFSIILMVYVAILAPKNKIWYVELAAFAPIIYMIIYKVLI